MKKSVKGFTLIELLIVIAIIGILASVVLVSLSSAREKAKVAAYKAQVHSIQAAAVLQCDSALLSTTAPGVPAGGYVTAYAAGAITSNFCGAAGTGVFNINVTPTGLAATNVCVQGAALTAVSDTGVVFPVGC